MQFVGSRNIAECLHSILGPHPEQWLFPRLAAAGDGLGYVTAWDHVRDDVDSLLGL